MNKRPFFQPTAQDAVCNDLVDALRLIFTRPEEKLEPNLLLGAMPLALDLRDTTLMFATSIFLQGKIVESSHGG